VWFWLLLAGTVVAVGLLLVIDGLRRERRIARDWELVLTPRGQRALDRLESDVRAELELAEMTHQRAAEARERGDIKEAMRLVDAGCDLIGAYAPRMIKALAAMMVLSRMAAAVAPVRPLRPRDFRLAQLVQLAYVGRFVHHLLVTTAERFRLRAYLLQRGFKTVGSLALRWRSSVPDPGFDGLGDVTHDVGALSDESLVTFRVLLVSLAAERRV
jgi:hypothetical protein